MIFITKATFIAFVNVRISFWFFSINKIIILIKNIAQRDIYRPLLTKSILFKMFIMNEYTIKKSKK